MESVLVSEAPDWDLFGEMGGQRILDLGASFSFCYQHLRHCAIFGSILWFALGRKFFEFFSRLNACAVSLWVFLGTNSIASFEFLCRLWRHYCVRRSQ